MKRIYIGDKKMMFIKRKFKRNEENRLLQFCVLSDGMEKN